MPTYGRTMLRILDDNNIEYPSDILKIITPLGLVKTAEYYIGLGLDMKRDDIVSLMEKYMIHAYTYEIDAKAHVPDVLVELKKRDAHLHVLTASPHVTLDPCLKRLGLYELFDNVWSCQDFNTTKSDPEIYRSVAERIGADVEEVLFLDDNLNADLTAKSAGMKVCGVFDESSREYTEQIRSETDYYVTDFSELLNI